MKCIYDRPGYTMPTCHDCVDTVGDGRHCTSGCVEDLLEEIEKLLDENAKLKRHLREAVKLAKSISITVCREGREEEIHPAEKSPMVEAWKLALGEGRAE